MMKTVIVTGCSFKFFKDQITRQYKGPYKLEWVLEGDIDKLRGQEFTHVTFDHTTNRKWTLQIREFYSVLQRRSSGFNKEVWNQLKHL